MRFFFEFSEHSWERNQQKYLSHLPHQLILIADAIKIVWFISTSLIEKLKCIQWLLFLPYVYIYLTCCVQSLRFAGPFCQGPPR